MSDENEKDSFPAVHTALTCPYCKQQGHSNIHLTHSQLSDLMLHLSCYCLRCRKTYVVIYVRTMVTMAPIPKCYNAKISDCKGCFYFNTKKDQCNCQQPTTTAATNNYTF